MEDFRDVRVWVFDIDGVVLDSKSVKRDAWRGVFSDRSREDDEVLQKMVDAKVGDRYEILRRALLETDATGAEIPGMVQVYAGRYDDLVKEGIRERGMFLHVPEVLAMLSGYAAVYANSQTPDASLIATLEAFGIIGSFKAVLGSSASKVENLRTIIAHEEVVPIEVVMVGDEDKDLGAAREVGCRFIGIADEINGWSAGHEEFPVLASLRDILGILEIRNVLR